ncbi:U1 small nuclear ribonucleoprotein C-like isoform X1 [Camellia sinensis]|uniref:U1 small nuclear ribonucleoprotein C-like isoform X1 n=1 Tax=Camellia sinensis TaxID=4442 RepID=UPI001035DEE0|nr:U1 small nuclear ribonucleoprotein C-like isoform X1 [Camellia sinensis]
MPRYYCDYCDTYLTHDSPSVRKQHNAGYKHKANVRTYYQQFEAQQNQSLIDQKIKEHLGQTTAYQQVGAAYNALRPRVPILPTPMMPMAGNTQLPVNSPLIPGARPPVLPRPLPGYMSAPVMPPMVGPPGAAPLPGQVTNLPRPPPMGAPSAVPGTTMTPASVSTSMVTPAMYQAANSAPPTSGGFDSFNMSAQAPEANQYKEILTIQEWQQSKE